MPEAVLDPLGDQKGQTWSRQALGAFLPLVLPGQFPHWNPLYLGDYFQKICMPIP